MTKKILVGALLIAVLVGAMVWSYERGMAANSALEATKLMVAVQSQKDCIKIADPDCTSESNRLLAAMVAGQLRRSNLTALSKSDRGVVEAFIREVESAK
ncbi:MAG: hypothetical protein DIZ77_08100 [endosymbiont of Seepiophila jonesi]|uniref:Uncharacterized protein n=1 Tax=endosymbiont of Lamellibrachia luymesi TaxID=2200907 RepID=A0A370DUF5_9GAMM|nr:MAG: hypothetical protein DIZ79_13940 [endosymbiont of Lamellibrachia luymesi]RDH92566.1 MAG: hypothetical protein DIZ77_08100 [endosymbiont of Seepiophila jonesi]RLJ16362.1 MAG: hypothetical protein DJ030_16495 [bacterium endosymbiont of Escarpia laminata]